MKTAAGGRSLFHVKRRGVRKDWHIIWLSQLQLYQVLDVGAKHRTYIIHDKCFIHKTHGLFQVGNKNFVPNVELKKHVGGDEKNQSSLFDLHVNDRVGSIFFF